jgi:hypothetical protein
MMIHSGICGSNSSWRSIIGKAFIHGFCWSVAKDEANYEAWKSYSAY